MEDETKIASGIETLQAPDLRNATEQIRSVQQMVYYIASQRALIHHCCFTFRDTNRLFTCFSGKDSLFSLLTSYFLLKNRSVPSRCRGAVGTEH